ncbi:hypothetical protein CDAR_547891 [Caerostris darwini]|uniref:Uncharacterized protein n=1 Tax=Caerostris darwini TaxID=1538125 RepID=A0AAV4WH36_9ARAC|nr:hypothetical protein CDAR_547891 [Caerostris darwini]
MGFRGGRPLSPPPPSTVFFRFLVPKKTLIHETQNRLQSFQRASLRPNYVAQQIGRGLTRLSASKRSPDTLDNLIISDSLLPITWGGVQQALFTNSDPKSL